jgi:methionine synthase II (cobalamin-independent)
MEKSNLYTTVVGSFPLTNTNENMVKIFEDLIQIGINFPCYPQLISMIGQFLAPLSKLIKPLREGKDGLFYLSDDFKIPDKPFALEYGEFIIKFLNKNPHLKKKITGTKACLTGPFTLASEVILEGDLAKGVETKIFNEPRGIMLDWIVDKFADIMKQIGKSYSDMGINIISMDEPVLSLLIGRKIFFHSKEFIIKTLNKAFSGIKDMPSIHVCGRLNPNLRDILLETNAKILDHEFVSNEGNFKIFEKKQLEQYEKFLAMGTIQTNFPPKKNANVKDYVEDINLLKNFIKKGIDLFGKENLFIKPDCGFGALKTLFDNENFAYEIVLSKLKNMVLATKEFM